MILIYTIYIRNSNDTKMILIQQPLNIRCRHSQSTDTMKNQGAIHYHGIAARHRRPCCGVPEKRRCLFSASPTACRLRGYRRAGTQTDRPSRTFHRYVPNTRLYDCLCTCMCTCAALQSIGTVCLRRCNQKISIFCAELHRCCPSRPS